MLNVDNLELENLELDKKSSGESDNASLDVAADLVQGNAEKSSSENVVELDPATQKYLYIKPVCQEFKLKLKKVVEDLEVMRLDIFTKKVEIVAKQKTIKEKMTFLDETKKVRIDKTEFEKSEKSAQNYAQLLDSIVHELTSEIAYYNVFISDEMPPLDKVVVPLQAPDKIEDYLELQISGIKRYLKNVKRDIAISFSRYTFGFAEQLKHLIYVESYIKSREVAPAASKSE